MSTPSFEIAPGTEQYYKRMTLDAALADTITMIEEWSYYEDAHGYCHIRPMLIGLVEAIAPLQASLTDDRECEEPTDERVVVSTWLRNNSAAVLAAAGDWFGCDPTRAAGFAGYLAIWAQTGKRPILNKEYVERQNRDE